MPELQQSFPLVDLGEIGEANIKEPSEEEWQRVGKDLVNSLQTFGYVYLTNHGIDDDVVSDLNKIGETFFDLPMDVKERSVFDIQTVHGYTAPGKISLDPKNSVDIRECFSLKNAEGFFPDKEIPSFRPTASSFLTSMWGLSKRLITAIPIGLGLDRDIFLDGLKHIGKVGNSSMAKLMHYLPLPRDAKQETVRCGVHADYGLLTFLFLDDMGGLKVKNCQGEYVEAKRVPDTILMITGQLFEHWTSGKLIAAEHYVVAPEDEAQRQMSRRSMAFFYIPDTDYLIRPVEESDKFKPMYTKELLMKKMASTFKK